jgi:ABC-type spermidine/putrescine transport system permease subunit II
LRIIIIVKYVPVDTLKSTSITNEKLDFELKMYRTSIRNYEQLLNDKEFLMTLHNSIYNRASKILLAKTTIVDIEQTQTQIEKELETRFGFS